MIHMSLAMLIALFSFAMGAAMATLIARKGKLLNLAATDTSPAAGEARTVPGAPGAPVVDAPLELHLVFNALNRVVMALNDDERTQEAVADMASYLRAWHELQRRPSQGAAVQHLSAYLSAYWRLSRWLHGQPTDALHIQAEAPDLPIPTLYRIAGDLTHVLRDQEACSKADTSIRLMAEVRGAGRVVSADVAVAGAPQAGHAALVGLPRGWKSDSTRLSLHLEWPVDD